LKKLIVKLFFAVLILGLFACSKRFGCHDAAAQSSRAYYLSPSGRDDNEGTVNSPWQTLKKINSIRLQPGDSVLLEGGSRFPGTLQPDSASRGTASAPIFIGSYGNGHAIISAGNDSAMVCYKNSYLVIKNLDMTGSGRKAGNIKDGLLLADCDHITADSLDISGFQKAGLMIYDSKHIVVSYIHAHDNGAAGITVEGSQGKKGSADIRILYCRAENNPGDPTNLTNHSGNGIVAGHCTGLLIDHCTATNNGWDMPRIGNGPVGIWCYETDSAVIQHCLAYRNKTSVGGADGGGFDLDGGVTNSIVQYNLSYGNQGSGYCIFQYWGASPWYNNVFRYNISENDGLVSDSRAGIYVWNSSGDPAQFHDCLVYNNTIYNSQQAAISFSETSARKQFAFYNNIFVGKDSLIRGDKGKDIFQGNDWWSIARGFNADKLTDFAAWTKKYQVEIKSGALVGFNLDPHFRSPGKLQLTDFPDPAAFDAYDIPDNSVLRSRGIDLKSLGIATGGLDFNQQAAPAAGIGASF
jgi:hypothetical protein